MKVVLFLRLMLLMCLLLLVFPHEASAQTGTLFVSSSGSGNDCSQNNPCPIPEALFKANDGDIIYFKGGEYLFGAAPTILIEKALTLWGGWDGVSTGDINIDPNAYVTILNGQGNKRLIDVNVATEPKDVYIGGFLIFQGRNSLYGGGIRVDSGRVTITENVFWLNSSGSGGGGIYSQSPDAVNIIDNVFNGNTAVNNGGAIYIDPENDPEVNIVGNGFYYNTSPTGAAIRTARVAPKIQRNKILNSEGNFAVFIDYETSFDGMIEIENNIIAHVDNAGSPERALTVWASNGVTHQIVNNTIVDVGRGVEASSGTTLLMTNNIFANSTISIDTANGNFSGTNNLFYGNGSDPDTLVNPVVGQDPLFVDAATDDYHIQRGSPAQNAGAVVALTEDYDGNPRPRGGAFDIGAFEIQSGFENFLPLLLR